MELNESDKKVIAQLEAMTLEQARKKLASGDFGKQGSGNHDFASSWLSVKEAEERDKRSERSETISLKALRTSTWANIIAIIAIILSIIAILS